MSKKLPAVTSASDGAILASAGKYARNAVMTVFDQIGGVERLAEVADENPEWFYEKLFAKTITREVETQKPEKSIDDYLDIIDADCEEAVDADFDDV
ncbi:MAG: hypothetical protein HC888_16135 [Candidatus Competibacteraceae bacterium]|nr:hypothetical protein [Candidatus Competibacteraceae bacterium]